MKEKIAVLTDSGSNVEKGDYENLFILPLLIQVKDQTYTDGVDISLENVLELIDEHKVTTSLPSSEVIEATLDKIKELGYTHVIVSTISSGLSGTYNIVRIITESYEGLEIALLDTKNISKASGYTTISALELIEEGKSFEEIIEILESRMKDNKVFFTVKSLDYLRRGGRIGLITQALATIINLKPIISCNDAGVYHTVKKTRGYNQAIAKTLELAHAFIEACKSFDLTLLVTRIDETVNTVKSLILDMFKKIDKFEIVKVSPALAIHTGPEAIGIALRKKDWI